MRSSTSATIINLLNILVVVPTIYYISYYQGQVDNRVFIFLFCVNIFLFLWNLYQLYYRYTNGEGFQNTVNISKCNDNLYQPINIDGCDPNDIEHINSRCRYQMRDQSNEIADNIYPENEPIDIMPENGNCNLFDPARNNLNMDTLNDQLEFDMRDENIKNMRKINENNYLGRDYYQEQVEQEY